MKTIEIVIVTIYHQLELGRTYLIVRHMKEIIEHLGMAETPPLRITIEDSTLKLPIEHTRNGVEIEELPKTCNDQFQMSNKELLIRVGHSMITY